MKVRFDKVNGLNKVYMRFGRDGDIQDLSDCVYILLLFISFTLVVQFLCRSNEYTTGTYAVVLKD